MGVFWGAFFSQGIIFRQVSLLRPKSSTSTLVGILFGGFSPGITFPVPREERKGMVYNTLYSIEKMDLSYWTPFSIR